MSCPQCFDIGIVAAEAEPVRIREGGRWSDIMAAPLDADELHQPLRFDLPPCSCAWCAVSDQAPPAGGRGSDHA